MITATISSCQPGPAGCTKGPIAGPFTPFAGVPFQLSTVSFSLGTSGLSVAADMTVDGLGQLSVQGTLQSLKTWSIDVSASAAQSWSPVPSVTFSPSFTGTVTDANGTVSFQLAASGVGGAPLFTLSPPGVTLTVGLGRAGQRRPTRPLLGQEGRGPLAVGQRVAGPVVGRHLRERLGHRLLRPHQRDIRRQRDGDSLRLQRVDRPSRRSRPRPSPWVGRQGPTRSRWSGHSR